MDEGTVCGIIFNDCASKSENSMFKSLIENFAELGEQKHMNGCHDVLLIRYGLVVTKRPRPFPQYAF